MTLRLLFTVTGVLNLDNGLCEYGLGVEKYDSSHELYPDCDYAQAWLEVIKDGKVYGIFKTPTTTIRSLRYGGDLARELCIGKQLMNVACLMPRQQHPDVFQDINELYPIMEYVTENLDVNKWVEMGLDMNKELAI